eukprot:GEMP01006106.1.p1 GENE.GEMP01006106.1~~GEMP01006106.1.p1  ORF type:complete len:1126 (+),score=196.95 GEMP01006106.1:346-3378(+)
MKQHNVKDLDPIWITFTDSHLEDRFVRITSESALSHLRVPMGCMCIYVVSELFFDRSWEVRPTIHIWNHDAAIVLNVCAIAVLASCYLLYNYFSQVVSTMKCGASVNDVEKLLVASVVWVVSLVLFFGTRSRVCNVFYVSEREVFGSLYDFPANDEVSILQTLTFTLVVFSIYVPMRFYYLLHLGVILAVLYPFSLCLHGTAAPTANVVAFYIIVTISILGQRFIETQRRGTFQAILHSLDARMDMQFEDVMESQVVPRTALERLLSNLRTVDRVFTHLEERARRHSTVGGIAAWGIAQKQMERSRKCINESRDILSHTEGFYALNVDTMFRNPELTDLDTVDFKRYMKTECGQAGGRKMYDGKMSERKATALLKKWNPGAAKTRVSVRRDTYQSQHRELLKSHPTDLQLMELNCNRSNTTVDTTQTGDKSQMEKSQENHWSAEPTDRVPSLFYVDISGVGIDWNFDTLSLGARTGNRSLIFVGEKTVVPLAEQVFPCVESTELMRLFVRRIWAYYLPDNPYHNEAHAATVCHMAQYLFNNSGLDNLSSSPERMGLLVAALGHDCGHFGRNNLFCQNSGHSVAFLYNDYAVLESMHAAITIRLLATGDSNCMALLDILSLEQRRAFKSTVIGFIMETDMYKHYEALSKFRCKIEGDDWCLEQTGCRASLGKMIMKAADVGQAAVKWDLHLEWSMRVLAEFFEQGDEEAQLQLPISTLCDRGTYDLLSSQKFFADVLCCPMFVEIRKVAVSEEDREAIDVLILEVCANRDKWSSWSQEFAWDPKKHHWPPTKWWGEEWKKYTPTGKVLLGDKNKVDNTAMPYPCNQQLSQNTCVKSHLELITRYNPGARARGYDDGSYCPKDWNCEARGNSPHSSRSSGGGPRVPFGMPCSPLPVSSSESGNSCSSFVCDLNTPSDFIDPKRLTTSSVVTSPSTASKSPGLRGLSTEAQQQTGVPGTDTFRPEDASNAGRPADDDSRADVRKRMSSVNSSNIEAAQRRFTENWVDFRRGNA